jgi:hypothetical protein
LEVGPFGPLDGLAALGERQQVIYLRRYLEDLGAATVITEPYFFDRDYLAEFAAFYSTSAAGYPNVCRRLHFFADEFDRSLLEVALGDDAAAVAGAERLRAAYLGFVVVRPIPAAPLGRTVLRWYPDLGADRTPRVVTPSRDYECHIGGLALTVRGLAWQQQDCAVGACATIALWSALHASALDGLHGPPTTAAVTRAAQRALPLASYAVPNGGLDIAQLCEAIKAHGLRPVVIPGDLARAGGHRGFSRERFSASCAALIRSGYPALVVGDLAGAGHATCAVGFRAATPPRAAQGTVVHHDAAVPFIYLHDDNLGPSVRCAVSVSPQGDVSLRPSAPPRVAATATPDPTTAYPALVPGHLIAAVPEDLRTSPDALHVAGLGAASRLARFFDMAAQQEQAALPGLAMATRFARLHDYLQGDLAQALAGRPGLARVRLALLEQVPPMSHHIGVVRVGDGAVPLCDILFDTSDSDQHLPALAYVVYISVLTSVLHAMIAAGELPAGACIDAA